MTARWCDSQSGVFTSVDPALSSTNQPYQYANADPVNNSDPSGNATLGFCAQSAAALGIGFLHLGTGGIGAICLVETVFTPAGNNDIGILETTGQANGKAVGASIGVGVGYQVSNANHLWELGKHFTNVDISAGLLSLPIGVGGSYFWGTASNGKHIWGADGTVSLSEGESIAKFSTYTWVQQQNDPGIADTLRFAWQGLVGGVMDTASAIQDVIRAAKKASVPSSTGC
ncbi:MAG: RHS repeat-associated core domain-containing protein [Acidimicrobiales bacterium]